MKKFTPLYTLFALMLCSLSYSYGQNSFPASGPVGIGTLAPDPNYALDVNGAINATSILLNGTPLENSESPWTMTGDDLSYTTGDVDVSTLNATNIFLDGTAVVSSPWTITGNNLSYATGTIDVETLDVTNLSIDGEDVISSPWTIAGNNLSYIDGNIGVGTTDTQGYMFAVAGSMVAESVKVELEGNWPDFVFEKDYGLQSLKQIEAYIEKHGHLPNVPSAEKIKTDGINLGEMDAVLLRKIEELTLHSIQQQKEIESLKILNNQLNEQNKMILSLQERLLQLEGKN